MTNNGSVPTDKLNYALHLIDKLPQALLHRVAPLEAIRQRLADLEGRTCTGRPHWRDKNASGKTAKLYILHYTDQTCPIHGKPAPSQRNRVYVGNKPDRIADALAAIERDKERLVLEQQRTRLQSSVRYVAYQVKNLYRNLDYQPPEPGDDLGPLIPEPD